MNNARSVRGTPHKLVGELCGEEKKKKPNRLPLHAYFGLSRRRETEGASIAK